jgi:hypothetical protein
MDTRRSVNLTLSRLTDQVGNPDNMTIGREPPVSFELSTSGLKAVHVPALMLSRIGSYNNEH